MAYNFRYDYSKTLWMKMFLSEPDFENNSSKIFITFRQALEIIKVLDNITQGITKIIYLVGWQGLGHDDCWPEMDNVNEYLKRDCDATGKDSLCWLYEEAKKYNTVISVHVNVSDVVKEDGIFHELVAADAICNDIDGKPAEKEFARYDSKFCKAERKAESKTVDSGKNRLILDFKNAKRSYNQTMR